MALKKLICIIDVGHGGSDSGAVGNGVYEKVANLNTALGLKAKLEKLGVIVYMTRTNDSYVSLEDRCSFANRIARENKDANIIFISVHHNAGGGDRGEVIHSVVRGEGEKLAHIIGNEMQLHLGQQKKVYERKGSDNRDYYYVIRNTSMTALIVEVAFLDNINDVQICDSAEEQIRNGEVIGCGIGKYFGLISNCGDDNKPTPPLTTDNLYRVRASWQDVKSQQGAYKDLNNAKVQADKTKLNVYDKDGNLVYSANSQPIPTPSPIPQPIAKSVTYQVHTTRGVWYPNVVDLTDYAGVFGQAIDGVYVSANVDIKTRVHIKGGSWLPWVNQRSDYAGIYGQAIDGIQIDSAHRVKYRVYVGGRWLPFVQNVTDYAGIYGQNIEGLQVVFE